MKKTPFKLAALLLAVMTLAVSFAGCAKNEEKVQLTKVQYVYKTQDLTMPGDMTNVQSVYAAGDALYLYGSYNDENYTSYGPRLYRMKTDGTEVLQIPLGIPDTEQNNYYGIKEKAALAIASGDIAVGEPNGESPNKGENVNIQNIYVQSDGTIWYVENRSVYDNSDPDNSIYEEYYTLKKISETGEVLLSVDLNTLKTNEDDWFYVNTFVVDTDGYAYLCITDGIAILDPEGKLYAKLTVDETVGGINRLVLTDTGKAICNLYTQTGGNTLLREIDRDAKAFGPDVQITTDGETASMYQNVNILAGFGSSLYYSDDKGVYAFDMATGTSTPVLNYINSDLDTNSIGNLMPISTTQMISTGYDNETGNTVLYLLTKVPDEDVVAKRIITLGTTGLNYYTRKAVINFNKTNEEYRIEVRDYSSYNGAILYASSSIAAGETEYDWEAGMKKFNTEIISGNIPDIIQIDSNMPYDSYVAKGLLSDLYPFFEKDETLKKEDYLLNIFTAFETNGKLYSVTPSFSVYTLVGKTSRVGDRTSWTMDDLVAAMQSLPEGAQLFSEMTRDNFLQFAITLSSSSYIDQEKGTCSFNTESFQTLLKLAKTFPEEIDYETMYGKDYDWTQYELQYRNDKTLLMIMYMYDFAYLHTVEAATFGEPVSLIGFPNDSGAGSAIIANQQYAIASSSKNKDGAWAFLRYFLTDEYQGAIDNGEFPVKLSALEKYKARAMEPNTYEDENGNTVEMPNTYYIDNQEIDIGYPTQADVDRIYSFISSLDTVYRTDSSLMEIINEEAGAFFVGQKTVEEVSNIIQNRVQIYISETR
ncbi:MAG: extracellular solute-binding protein [Clostridiaceae bacterium]|nr:extracellular solute-binding protein [Clostridiaceae bacterium]